MGVRVAGGVERLRTLRDQRARPARRTAGAGCAGVRGSCRRPADRAAPAIRSTARRDALEVLADRRRADDAEFAADQTGAGPYLRHIQHRDASDEAVKRQAALEDVDGVVQAIRAGRHKASGGRIGKRRCDRPRSARLPDRQSGRLRQSPSAPSSSATRASTPRLCDSDSAGGVASASGRLSGAARRPRRSRCAPSYAMTRSPPVTASDSASRWCPVGSPGNAPGSTARQPAKPSSVPSSACSGRRARACPDHSPRSAARRRARSTGRTARRSAHPRSPERSRLETPGRRNRPLAGFARKDKALARTWGETSAPLEV